MDCRLFLIFTVVLVASGCTSQNKTAEDIQQGKKALQESQESNKYTVKYTESGFEPGNLIIREGDTVTWIDRSNQNLSVSTSYENCRIGAESISCKPVENISHTFEEKGKYTYHNSENLDHTATIRVNARNTY